MNMNTPEIEELKLLIERKYKRVLGLQLTLKNFRCIFHVISGCACLHRR